MMTYINADHVLDKTRTTNKKHTIINGENLPIRILFLCKAIAAMMQVASQKASVKPPPTKTVGLKPPSRMFCKKSDAW